MSLPDRELRHFFPSIPSGKTLGFTVQGKKCTTFFFSLQELLLCLFLLSTLIYFLFLFYFPWFMVEWFLICLLGFETIFLISWLNMRGYSKAGFYHGYFWNFASLNYTFMKKNEVLWWANFIFNSQIIVSCYSTNWERISIVCFPANKIWEIGRKPSFKSRSWGMHLLSDVGCW